GLLLRVAHHRRHRGRRPRHHALGGGRLDRRAGDRLLPDPALGAAVSEGDALIELEGVWKSFGALSVLRGVDLRIAAGQTFTIPGGSGSGKSVCLKHMIGLLRADRGRVRALGRDITRASEPQLIPIRTAVAMVFQSAALFDSLSVYENVAYPLREHRDWDE